MRPILFLCCLFALMPLPAAADGHLPEEKIAAAAEKWSQLYAQRDLDALMTLYHEEAMLFTNGQPALIGPAAIRAYFEAGFKRTKAAKIDFKIERMRIFGDVANMVSLYKMELDVGQDKPVIIAGRSMLVYKRDAFGNWLLFADMDNQAPDADAAAFDAAQ